ncbi:12170_t:CDS:2, partial [Racocetra fulgida]
DSQKTPSHEVFESFQETLVETAPQDMCADSQYESENFILDPENSYDRKITVSFMYYGYNDAYSQYGEISKATKYNHNDSVRTFWKSNTIHAKLYNERLDDREVNSTGGIRTPADLIFNRFKMFCRVATRNADGSIWLGLPK